LLFALRTSTGKHYAPPCCGEAAWSLL
jgi:hypothetical protein